MNTSNTTSTTSLPAPVSGAVVRFVEGGEKRSFSSAQPAPAGLERLTDKCSPPEAEKDQKRALRVSTNRRRFDFLRRESVLPRQRGCMKGTVNGTALVMDRAGHWRCAGLMRCSRVDCPECGVVILVARQDEIETAADRWVRFHGGTLAFITLTFSHTLADSYDVLRDVRAAAWRSIGRGQRWKNDRARFRVRGFIRVNEDTYGLLTGWHCHIHVLVFLDYKPRSKEALAAVKGLGRQMFKRWQYAVVKLGRKASRVAQDVKEVSGRQAAENMGSYLTKQLDVPNSELGASMARELVGARSKVAGQKVATHHYSVTDLLDLAITGDTDAGRLYALRELAAAGKRTISWSDGLRQLVGLREDEETDGDIMAAEDSAAIEDRVVFSVRGGQWAKLCRFRYGMGRLLEVGETRGDAAAAAYLDALGIEYTSGNPAPDTDIAAHGLNAGRRKIPAQLGAQLGAVA